MLPALYAAAITPRDTEGNVDFGATFDVLDHLGKARVGGIVLFGAAGEYPALTAAERCRLFYLAVKRSRVPVLAGVGAASLDASVSLARDARDAGAAALLLPPPYFYPYPQEDIREFYLQFAEQVGPGIPLFLSNLPRSTAAIEPETALDLLKTGLFAGMEDASGDLSIVARLQPYPVWVADDAVFTRARCAGARGAVSAAACAVPELLVALDAAIAAANHGRVQCLDAMLREFVSWMQRFPLPILLKTAAGVRGLKTGPLPVPLSPARAKSLEEFRDWFGGWLPGVKRLAL